jgi:hypothetical protein
MRTASGTQTVCEETADAFDPAAPISILCANYFNN